MARAGAERDPDVRARLRIFEEALGPEALGLGEDLGVAMDQVDARHQRPARREDVTADLARLAESAGGDRQDGALAQGLADDRVEVGVVVAGQLGEQAVADDRVVEDALERPREPVRGRLVAGDQQGQHLVADLRIGDEAVLVRLRRGQDREHVVAALVRAQAAADLDLLEQDVVDLPGHRHHPAERGAAAELALELRHQRQRVLGDLQHRRHQLAELAIVVGQADADRDPDDHLGRDPPRRSLQGEGLADRPGGELAGRDLRDQVAVAADRGLLEGGHQQPAVVAVLGAVEQEQRAIAEHGAEQAVGRAHPEHLRVAGQHLPCGGVVGDHRGPLERAEADAEDRPVAAQVALHERDRVAEPAPHLQQPRRPRAGRQPRLDLRLDRKRRVLLLQLHRHEFPLTPRYCCSFQPREPDPSCPGGRCGRNPAPS